MWKYTTYFQSLVYFRTELLTRAKFSRHGWTGFCGPTGDGKWSHQKNLSMCPQKFGQISSVSGFANMTGVV